MVRTQQAALFPLGLRRLQKAAQVAPKAAPFTPS
jgi:hypothetical protein